MIMLAPSPTGTGWPARSSDPALGPKIHICALLKVLLTTRMFLMGGWKLAG